MTAQHNTPATPRGQTTAPREREERLDALRGVAILGILLINIYPMVSPVRFLPDSQTPTGGWESANSIAVGLAGVFAAGKFIALLAFLFGLGMGILATRSARQGSSATAVLVRRSAFLIFLGFAHMTLLYPGDILFSYGVTSLVALFFLRLRPRALLSWAAGIALGFLSLATAIILTGVRSTTPATSDATTLTAAYDGRDFLGLISAQAPGTLATQNNNLLFFLFSILPLFLLGIAAAKARTLQRLSEHPGGLKWIAGLGIGIGAPANLLFFPTGFLTVVGITEPTGPSSWLLLHMYVDYLGVPLLAAGYAAAALLWWQHHRPPRSLVAVGRMALTAYLAQSVLVLSLVLALGLYGHLDYLQSLGIVVGVWAVLLIACPLWLRRFAFGPLEWLWRTWTYLRPPTAKPNVARPAPHA